jgi:hypothetical protein
MPKKDLNNVDTIKVYCMCCNTHIIKPNWNRHNKSKKHHNNNKKYSKNIDSFLTDALKDLNL